MISSSSINVFDATVLGILALSGAVAFFRGFVREMLSLGAWVGAAAITLYLYPHSFALIKQHISSKNEHVIGAASAIGTYMAALIGISIINSIIIRYVKTGVEVGLFDNFMGLLFGLLRGAFIVSLGFLILSSVISKNNPPDWFTTSFTRDYLQMGGNALVSVAPEYLNDIEGMVKKEAEEQQKENNSDDASGTTPPADDSGYKASTDKDFNRLLDSTGSK